MRGFIVAFGAAALTFYLVAGHEWPKYESDNYYRNFIDLRFKELSEEFYVDFLATTTTAPETIPTEFGNYEGEIDRVSSACSCITYSISTTTIRTSSDESVSSTSTPEPMSSEPTTSSSLVSSAESSSAMTEPSTSSTFSREPTSESSCSAPAFSSSEGSEPLGSASVSSGEWTTATSYSKWTTSTICETKTYTLSDCPPDADCPGDKHFITKKYAVSTTVRPVAESEPSKSFWTSKIDETEGPQPLYSNPVGTGSYESPSPTDSDIPISTAGTGHTDVGIAAVVGVIAAALL